MIIDELELMNSIQENYTPQWYYKNSKEDIISLISLINDGKLSYVDDYLDSAFIWDTAPFGGKMFWTNIYYDGIRHNKEIALKYLKWMLYLIDLGDFENKIFVIITITNLRLNKFYISRKMAEEAVKKDKFCLKIVELKKVLDN